jgi:hypothetical protein
MSLCGTLPGSCKLCVFSGRAESSFEWGVVTQVSPNYHVTLGRPACSLSLSFPHLQNGRLEEPSGTMYFLDI